MVELLDFPGHKQPLHGCGRLYLSFWRRASLGLGFTVRTGTLVLVLLPLLLTYHWNWIDGISIKNWTIIFSLILSAGAIICAIYNRNKVIPVFTSILLLSLVNILCVKNPGHLTNYVNDKCYPRKDLFLTAYDGIMFLNTVESNTQSLIYTYDYTDTLDVPKDKLRGI